MSNAVSYPQQGSIATYVGIGMFFGFIPIILIYDYLVGLGHESVEMFYFYVPATLIYDALIRVVLDLESISEFIWKIRFLQILSCVYSAAGGIVLVASTPQWSVGSSVYAIIASGLLIAHLGWEVLPGLRGIL